jgi:hypothetical protein
LISSFSFLINWASFLSCASFSATFFDSALLASIAFLCSRLKDGAGGASSFLLGSGDLVPWEAGVSNPSD